MPSFRSVILSGAVIGLTVAQDLSVPSTWRHDDTSFQKVQRTQIAQRAIATLLSEGSDPTNIGALGWWPSANAFSAFATADLYSGQTTNKDMVLNGLNTAFTSAPPFRQTDFNDDSGWWTNAAMYAYTAYGDQASLDQATQGWDEISKWVITSDDGSSPKGQIQGTCAGKSMAGAVFWNGEAHPDDFGTNSITASLYALTSAQLYKFTQDQKYSDAAKRTLQWIMDHTFDADTNLINDGMSAADCTTSDHWYFTYNQGMFVAAAAVYTSATGDNSFFDAATTVAASAMKQTTRFQGEDGIITEGSDDHASDGSYFRGAYLRGLALLYYYGNNGDPNAELNILIHSYVDVQYSALIELDSNDSSGVNTNAFTVNWHGPFNADDVYSFEMLPAVDALVAAILTNNNGDGSGFRSKREQVTSVLRRSAVKSGPRRM